VLAPRAPPPPSGGPKTPVFLAFLATFSAFFIENLLGFSRFRAIFMRLFRAVFGAF
jgi:hypothetical protein